MGEVEYDLKYAEQQLQRSHSPLRRFVKQFYLWNVVKDVIGPTVDFGCGAGQLLELLPEGSLGLEVNPYLVETLQNRGLNVKLYDPSKDQLALKDVPEGQFSTLIMSHVLEHFDNATDGLKHILSSCNRLGINRVIIIVPGKKGYAYDKTHKTFVNRNYVETEHLTRVNDYVMSTVSYFPVNVELVGNFFTFHEMKMVFNFLGAK